MKKIFKITQKEAIELLNLPSERSPASRVELVTQLLEGIELDEVFEGVVVPACMHPMVARYKSIDGIRMGCLACDEWGIE